jgi:hypothetical protein
MKTLVALTFLLLFGNAWADDPSFEQLASEKKDISSVIGALPKDYRTQQTTAYDSDSSQFATPSNPRAILYGNQPYSPFFTFNGGIDKAGNYFRGGRFGEGFQMNSKRDSLDWFEIEEVNGALRFLSKPQNCLKCHGSSLGFLPIWDSYPRWHNMNGSHDDDLYNQTYSSDHPVNKNRSQKESTDFLEFKKTAKLHPRYKYLFENGDEKNLYHPYNHGLLGPNAQITEVISNLLSDLVMAKLKQSPNKNLIFAFLASEAVGCNKDLEGPLWKQIVSSIDLSKFDKNDQSFLSEIITSRELLPASTQIFIALLAGGVDPRDITLQRKDDRPKDLKSAHSGFPYFQDPFNVWTLRLESKIVMALVPNQAENWARLVRYEENQGAGYLFAPPYIQELHAEARVSMQLHTHLAIDSDPARFKDSIGMTKEELCKSFRYAKTQDPPSPMTSDAEVSH